MANSKFYSGDLNTDFYLFEKGYQSESINYYLNTSNYEAKHNQNIHFSGVSLSDLQLRKEGFDLVIKAKDSNEKVTLKNYYLIQEHLDSVPNTAVTLQDHNLTELTSQIENLAGDRYIYGTNASDLLIDGTGDNIITGWNGNDTIYGLDGNDILYGMGGRDILYGGNGDDYLEGATTTTCYTVTTAMTHYTAVTAMTTYPAMTALTIYTVVTASIPYLVATATTAYTATTAMMSYPER